MYAIDIKGCRSLFIAYCVSLGGFASLAVLLELWQNERQIHSDSYEIFNKSSAIRILKSFFKEI